MRFSRRSFLLQSGLATAALAMSGPAFDEEPLGKLPMCRAPSRRASSRLSVAAKTPLNTNTLAKFVDPLPILHSAQASGTRADPGDPTRHLAFYRIEMREFDSQLHRDLQPTRQWGYAGSVPGPTLETRTGEGLIVEWVNALPRTHLLPVDHYVHGAEKDKPLVRTVPHVHGAKVPPESDGYPERWFAPGKSVSLHYPNQQDAATLWYHDHAMGITRLNMFSGLFGTFIVRDAIEEALGLPSGAHEIPLILCDRSLDQNSQLLYPVSGNPDAPWVPEFYGNTFLCNGKINPYLEVEPCAYRFRIVNVANARFFDLTLSNGQSMFQIGSDAGLLDAPVALERVQLLPAERADVVIDFSVLSGQQITLRHASQDLMQFRVGKTASKSSAGLPKRLRPVEKFQESQAIKTRLLTLGERDDYDGVSTLMLLDGKSWDAPVTERPALDSIEIWSLVNLTGDAHPIHLHLVRFQILDRRPFDVFAFNRDRTLRYTGPAVVPPAQEAGWKDTVRADAGQVTRIIMRFEGYAGRYVWHCHLLEHEDNEMMRPFEVV